MSGMGAGAAFFRLETALTKEPSWRHARALAGQAPSIRARLSGLGAATLGGALGLHPALGGPGAAARTGWAQVRGFSRDRIEVLGRDHAVERLVPAIPEHVRRLLDEVRSRGLRPVLVAETIRAIALPVAEALEIELVLSSDLAWSPRDEATGALEDGAIGPELGPAVLRAFAAEHAIDLERSSAYGGTGGDAILLSHVGAPCAIDPDADLSRIARDLRWPIVRGRPEAVS